MNLFKLCFSYSFILLLLLLPQANSLSFNFSSFRQNTQTIFYQGDAFAANGVIQVTKNELKGALTQSAGRASYSEKVCIWDSKNGKLTDFTTHFSFVIDALNSTLHGDGLSFFLAPFENEIPSNSSDGYLALFNSTSVSNKSKNQIVAVEFDTFMNPWDPSEDHVGINVNSIVSVANVKWSSSIKNGSTANAWVSYNSSTKNLSVFLTYANNPVFGGNSTLWHVVDLRKVLPQWVRIGFSASTGEWIELHTIRSWSFSSSLESSGGELKNRLVIALIVCIVTISSGLGLFLLIWWRKKATGAEKSRSMEASIDDFEREAGPKRFTFSELSKATNNFDENGKLGEGGFGGVYKGLLGDTKPDVAVKRVSRGSKQGKKEYVSEVRVISRLRHRNLVQLIGWCHEKSEFLLVYELLPNGSLDSHLFSGKSVLTWAIRYKIVRGLASALLYLHEEWEQCVVHRDIKSSNIMLDTNYNAKLGDFGLARLVDHELGSQTTVLAGTMGYLAPECVTTGKASKESDIYSFGVVALEIACGRRPVDPKAEPNKVRLVERVWDLYGEGKLLEVADEGLDKKYDERQMECLMIVGLWCCHPDHTLRPSVRQVINVLNFEAPLPSLPSKLPVAMYYAPPMHMCRFTYTSSGRLTGFGKYQTQCSRTSCSTSTSGGSSKTLLKMHGLALV